jgi:hypothetical protein
MSERRMITKMELLSKREHAAKNPNIVTAREMEDFFDIKHTSTIENIYRRMDERCYYSHDGIFRKPNFYAISDFYDLIKNNVDIADFYKRNNKILDV